MDSFVDILPELKFETSRSSGKGGQNVNKVESKVTLVWQYTLSTKLSDEHKNQIKDKAKSYLSDNIIRITAQQSRSQLENKKNTVKKLEELLQIWLKKDKPRKPTKVPKSVKQKRLKNKKINAQIKKNRFKPNLDD